jgi:hypothetical protein
MILFLFLLCFHLSYSFHAPKPKQRLFIHQNSVNEAGGHSIGFYDSAAALEETQYSQLLWRINDVLQESRLNHPINNEVDQAHKNDLLWAQRSPLPFEKPLGNYEYNDKYGNKMMHRTIEYESIIVEDMKTKYQDLTRIAIRTKKSTPILNEHEIQLLKLATEAYWSNQPQSSSSRFTYQRKGNSESHLSDIVTFNKEKMGHNDLSELVDDVLLQRIYPWIREAFLSKEENLTSDELSLYVYDSLFIRYNATEANDSGQDYTSGPRKHRIGAGQPLHRDLGYVSVNIMLNDPSEFQGGGTFFEQQLISWDETADTSEYLPDTLSPLKPLGAGHALAHYSSHRHAGAATFEGVRDVLVIFIAAAEVAHTKPNQPQSAPRWERAARLKSTARPYCQQCFASSDNLLDEWICRIQHLKLAIDAVPNDGEAWHYLGMTLAEFTNYKHDSFDEALFDVDSVLELAVACLEEGEKYTPCDARLYNNIGLALEKTLLRSNILSSQNGRSCTHQKIKSAYEKAVAINSICSRIGCDVASDFERVCLNFGLYLSYQDDFHGAVAVLEMIEQISVDGLGTSKGMSPERQRVIDDASGLLLFCKKHISSHMP